jgi:BirA family biotin operon repressor/biotin-[acetyl-CoA-carboxylase] ligase
VEGVLASRGGRPGKVGLKWPNDLLISGRKAGGILCEAVGRRGVIAGIGVNVKRRGDAFSPDLRDRSTCLEEEVEAEVARGPLAGDVIREIRHAVTRGTGKRLGEDELDAYRRRDALMGEKVDSETEGRGTALGLTPRGTLMVERIGGELREVRAGSVTRVAR